MRAHFGFFRHLILHLASHCLRRLILSDKESVELHDILYLNKLAFTVIESKAINPPGQIIRSLMICHIDQKKLLPR